MKPDYPEEYVIVSLKNLLKCVEDGKMKVLSVDIRDELIQDFYGRDVLVTTGRKKTVTIEIENIGGV